MNESAQDALLKELDFIRVSIMLKPHHADFLKTIDPDNLSKAVRVLIDSYMKQTKIIAFEKYLIYFMFGLALVGIGTMLDNLYVSLTSIFVGMFAILFSLYMYLSGKLKYERNKNKV